MKKTADFSVKLNIKELLLARGITEPFKWLRKRGISHYTSNRLNQGKPVKIKPEDLITICIDGYCTPDDIIVVTPSAHFKIDAAHPVKKLCNSAIPNFESEMKTLSVPQLREMKAKADEMKTKK